MLLGEGLVVLCVWCVAVVARDEVVEREGLWRGGERKGERDDFALVVEEEEEEDKRCMAAAVFLGAVIMYVIFVIFGV